ncbi:CBS domain protein [Nonomuraea coxensis DSM 45129]|uniref:CBS domain protein n=1 Tax=Nonomuraea coxensis DSM 45129 TaxID=1122611 RepID=A0ABX8U4K1_9ACTN|nr:CBS domain-containing protein [Nonomuraea coxensis]QYC41821.1 CBS domain protein [Nonomuraea coxensis DSM 45129]
MGELDDSSSRQFLIRCPQVRREVWSAGPFRLTQKDVLVRARDLLADFPTVGLDSPVIDAARMLADHDLPGLIVVDDDRTPFTILPGTEVLRLAVPTYCLDDPALARVVDEAHADTFLDGLDGRTVREALPQRPRELPLTDPDATVLELAALMARTRSPLVAVVTDDQRLIGAVTLQALLDRVLAA